jgi:hypothetical protein
MIDDGQKERKKRTFQKSRPYPPASIDEALKFADIVEKLGARNVSEPIILKELDLKAISRSFWGKTASAKQFGLISVDGKSYTLTERARLILRPRDESSKKNLLIETFLTPELYKDLYEKFQEKQILPGETLANILFHDHSINVNASKDAAKAFIDSAKYVGLLGPDNVLKSTSRSIETIPFAEHKGIELSKQVADTISATVTATIKLSKGTVSIILPEGGITKKDSERLQKLIDAYVIENEMVAE